MYTEVNIPNSNSDKYGSAGTSSSPSGFASVPGFVLTVPYRCDTHVHCGALGAPHGPSDAASHHVLLT